MNVQEQIGIFFPMQPWMSSWFDQSHLSHPKSVKQDSKYKNCIQKQNIEMLDLLPLQKYSSIECYDQLTTHFEIVLSRTILSRIIFST